MQPHRGCGHHHSTYPVQNLDAGQKWIKSLTKDRLGKFVGGHYGDVNLSAALFTHRIDDDPHVKLQVWSAPGLTKPSFEEAMQQKFKAAKKGESFGPSWTNHWWKVEVNIPAYWVQYERIQFEFDPGCEAMIFSLDGTPLQGITGGYGGDRRVEYIIPRDAVVAGHHEFVIESSCNGMFGVPWNGDTIQPPDMNRFFRLASADLVVPNQDAWRLLADFTTLRELADSLPGNSSVQNQAMVIANKIMNVFDITDPASVNEARKVSEEVFGENWEKAGSEVYNAKDKENRPRVWGIGHCHIDSAWLWPFRVTQQKVARSWSTQVDLMERYPEHRFCCSSAQQYKWLEELYPKLFSRVKDKVASQAFHPIGGSWVENDGNMPSGESLIRQMTFGQRYFQTRFGVRCETAWLPDSFGLTGSYPQLIRGAGMKWFFTQKLSWNNVNTFPHTTFNWVGIDGTQVLCHMTPVDTYTAQATVGDINRGVTNHKNLESSDTALLVFGNGDGGGGPLAKMLENLRRIRATANHSRDVPVVHMGSSVDDFFTDIEERTDAGRTLPNWHGELYLEFHRGTYTSHGSIKRGNRNSEILLRDVELVATLASVFQLPDASYIYPKQRIDEMWEKVLLCQFHDVLPGSSIGMVYEDAEKLYAEVRKEGKALLEEVFGKLLTRSHTLIGSQQQSPVAISSSFGSGTIVGVNTTMFQRLDVVAIPLSGSGLGISGSNVVKVLKQKVVQLSEDGTIGYALMQSEGGLGLSVPRGLLADCDAASVTVTYSGDFVLRNASVQLTIRDGRITSLVDKHLDRELIRSGQTGGFVIFDDKPNYWDAWDVEIHHLEKFTQLEFSDVKVIAKGPLRAAVSACVRFGKSTATVTISLDAIAATVSPNSRPYFRFDTVIDWHERHKILKFELPLDIHNDNATYETQFGFVQRPTHKNTTWDMAKFEVCGLKYADLSEYGYGVAILSDSKYGFSCIGNVLRISLLRGATAPDAEQDQGVHEISWAVMPHQGHFIHSDVPQAAYLFNSPLHVRFVPETSLASSALGHRPPFQIHGAPNVILETVKRGDDDNFSESLGTSPKTIILRVYEAFGGHANVRLRVSDLFPIAKVYETNLLEEELEELEVDGEGANEDGVAIKLDFHGFEVKTVKLVLADTCVKPGQGAIRTARKSDEWIDIEKLKQLYL